MLRATRTRAVHEDKSFSAWVAELVNRELATPADQSAKPMNLAEAMRVPGLPESFSKKAFPLPDRRQRKHRQFPFESDEA